MSSPPPFFFFHRQRWSVMFYPSGGSRDATPITHTHTHTSSLHIWPENTPSFCFSNFFFLERHTDETRGRKERARAKEQQVVRRFFKAAPFLFLPPQSFPFLTPSGRWLLMICTQYFFFFPPSCYSSCLVWKKRGAGRGVEEWGWVAVI